MFLVFVWGIVYTHASLSLFNRMALSHCTCYDAEILSWPVRKNAPRDVSCPQPHQHTPVGSNRCVIAHPFFHECFDLFLMSIQEHDSCCFYVSRNAGIVSATVIQWRCVLYGNDDYLGI